jgi:sarcosine oxidase subunit alpha
MNAFCDVLVVGSGPAGLMAAKAAADSGARVILAELEPKFGGTANWSGETIDGVAAAEWASTMTRDLKARDNVRLLPRTTVWGYYDDNSIAALERVTDHKSAPGKGEPRHRHWSIRAGSVVLATGAFERPLVFPGNDRPGVMLAGAAERYANEFGILPGQKIALFVNNDSAYRAAAAMKKAGAAKSRRRRGKSLTKPAANCCAAMPWWPPRAAGMSRASRCRSSTLRAAHCRVKRVISMPTACWFRAAGRRSSIWRARPA